MSRKFEDWDRVVHNSDGRAGVVESYAPGLGYLVHWDDDEGDSDYCEADELRREGE